MPGARMIFNARYFQIAKPGEVASKNKLLKNAAAGLVEYIATRESVIHNFTPEYELADATDLQRAKIEEFMMENQELKSIDEYEKYHTSPTAANATRLLTKAIKVIAGIDTGEAIPAAGSPATEKQVQRIQEFVSAAPNLKESMEYLDFLESPNFENASEFLSNAFENSMGSAVDPETLQMMVNYIATRPGVISASDHGLFSGDAVTDLEAYKQEVSTHTGNIYSTVVSLRREDADFMGFDTQAPWKDVVLSKLDVIAKNNKIPLEDLRWCAAMHNTGHHPHIHLMYWSEHPDKQNFLSKEGIEKIKSAFAHEIFRGEFEQIYTQQKTITNDLKEECVRLFDQLNKNADTYAGAPALIEKFSVLSGELQELKGKHQYKYLPGQLKALVNDMVDTIGEIPEIKKIHMLYEEQHNKMLSIYKNQENIPIRKLSEMKSGEHLYFLKNLVLRTADQFSQQHPEFYSSIEPDYAFQPKDYPDDDLSDMFPDDSPDNLIHESEQLVQQLHYAYQNGNPAAVLLLGEIFTDGLPGIEADLDTAMMWYGKEAAQLPQAAYRLSEIALDVEQSGMYTHLAAVGFLKELENSPNMQIIEDILNGKYRYGDIEKQYHAQFEILKALDPDTEYKPPSVLQDSPENGERLFYLAKLQARGYTYHPDFAPAETLSVPPDIEKAKDLLQLAYDAGYAAAAHELGSMEESPYKSLRWYLKGSEAGHPASMLEAARMLESGAGGIQDLETAEMLYERAAQPEAMEEPAHRAVPLSPPSDSNEAPMSASVLYKQAKKLEKEKATQGQAFALFKQSADDGNAWAQYKTAQYIYRGLSDLDRTEAHPYFALARESFWKEEQSGQENNWRDYVVAGMYAKGLGTNVDENQAYSYYGKALAGFHEDSSSPHWMRYVMGRMYQYGLGTEIDMTEAFRHLKDAADLGHPRAKYDTASCYQHGKGTEADSSQAQKYYAMALTDFLTADQKEPDEWQEYTIARMYANGIGTAIVPEKAFEYYSLAAKHGHTKAAYETGRCHDKGLGTEPDQGKAQLYYKQALEGFLQEEDDAQNIRTEYSLAIMYQEGLGTEKDPEKALMYMKMVADSGNGRAQYMVAQYLENGSGIEKSPALAQEYYSKALENFLAEDSENPSVWTQSTIAKMYEKGMGTGQDPEKAFQFYQLAAGGGHTFSQYKTAECLEDGTGTAENPELAQEYYAKALQGFLAQNEENPDAWVQYRIARMYEKGLGAEISLKNAFPYYRMAADNDHTYAQYKTAECLNSGTGTEKKPAQAQEYYAKALPVFLQQNEESPDTWMQYRIAGMYEYGKGCDQDPEKAFQFYQLAANDGHTYSQYKTAEALEDGTSTEKDPVLAGEYYAKALQGFLAQNEESQDTWLQYRIAGMYENGKGCEKDPEKAFQYYHLAADREHTFSQYKTAEALDGGTGVAKNSELAQEYYAKALQGFLAQNKESPDTWLQYRIAEMYEHGKGGDANPSAAFQYYKQAADAGHTPAAFQVGYAYHTGNGVPVNETFAQRYFKKAFQGFMKQEQQDPNAYTEFQIGRMYERGFGTEKDRDKAQEWYQKSADNGSEYAEKALERMEQQRSAEMLAASTSALQALLRACEAQMPQELRRPLGIDRKERRRIREKKHSMGMLEDWENTLE